MNCGQNRPDAKLICLGDSITYGYPLGPKYSWVHLLQQKTNLQLVNQGINGDTTGQMWRRFQRHVLAAKATHVHLLGGANDAWLGVDVAAAVANIEKMLQISHEYGITPMIGLPTPLCAHPAGGASFLTSQAELLSMQHWLADFRLRLQQLTAAHHVLLIDYYTPLCFNDADVDADAGNPVYFMDQCHLNEQGYGVMAQVALKALKTMVDPG